MIMVIFQVLQLILEEDNLRNGNATLQLSPSAIVYLHELFNDKGKGNVTISHESIDRLQNFHHHPLKELHQEMNY